MNKKNKIILIDSVDVIVSKIGGLNIAWGLSKAFYGAGLKLRQQRALEWVEMIQDNPQIFIQQILEQEEFQDGFVYALEKYLIERNEEKRKFLRNLYLGFSESENKTNFPLEKYNYIISQLTNEDIIVLHCVEVRNIYSSYQIFTNPKTCRILSNKEKYISNIYNLINLGILYPDASSRLGNIDSPFVFTSKLGQDFIRYIKK